MPTLITLTLLALTCTTSLAAEAVNLRQMLKAESSAEDIAAMDKILAETIAYGSQIYNMGGQQQNPRVKAFFESACFKLYEGAAYKIITELGDKLPTAKTALTDVLTKTAAEKNHTANAWAMRRCFDSLTGQPTRGGQPQPKQGKPTTDDLP